MHPAVIDRYGAACGAFAASQRSPIEFVEEVRPPTVYAWTTDGQTTNVPDTNEVVVTQVRGGQATERTIHIARVDGTWRWFTDCTPRAASRIGRGQTDQSGTVPLTRRSARGSNTSMVSQNGFDLSGRVAAVAGGRTDLGARAVNARGPRRWT